ncbi:Modification methylase HemK [Syntrophomonas zehnderi OL-4]|uniref:Release factor glutamine methyltransferase n=1 Tax=Syntrophomonas zehnderi OL-4 TaxID=690567 RepID=A0A0E4G915_9FIRM|nr:peptide chain release factor N(5)-glutamine methyltransferase [Syntrophomonas zehnderi]CFX02647.1 Modification methylase HemK [Syntrophomonas zehnderi OL-4]
MQRIWRIKDLLEWTTRYFFDRGIAESRLEAEILLAQVVQKDRVYLYANYEEPINAGEREIYREYIKRRISGEPTAYITGHKEFMSLDFKVTPDVLIPRADTEVLVETALALAQAENLKQIIDVGTGSGAIAVSLGVYLQDARIFASDVSPQALAVARENACNNNVQIHFIEGDLLQPLLSYKDQEVCSQDICQEVLAGYSINKATGMQFDMITANLPYIPDSEKIHLDKQVRDFEPHLALFAEGDGLELYRKLLPQAYALLKPAGIILLEIDPRQAVAVPDMMQGFTDIGIIKDLAGRARVVQARRDNHV